MNQRNQATSRLSADQAFFLTLDVLPLNQHLDDRSARGRRADAFLLQGFLERLIGHSLTRRLHQLQQGRLIEALRCRRLKLRQRRLMWIALALLKIGQLLN